MKFLQAVVAAALVGSATLIARVDAAEQQEQQQTKHAGSIRGLQNNNNNNKNGNNGKKNAGQPQHAGGSINDLKAKPAKPVRPKFREAAAKGIKDQYIVVLEDTVKDKDIESVAESLVKIKGGQRKGRAYRRALKGFAVRMTRAQAMELAEMAEVKYVEQDAEVTKDQSATWGLDRIDQRNLPLDDTYAPAGDGSGVTAYILDTGIRTSHNEFGGRASWGVNFAGDGEDRDCDGHGTHVAGTVGGNTYGVAPGVNLVAVKVLNCQGSGSWSGIINGIEWVMENCSGRCVANMSLGGGQYNAGDDAVNAAVASGIPFAVAAGNEDADACTKSPAAATNAITVGSTTTSDTRSSFSNYGSCVDIFAPGSSITSAWIGSDTATNTISGTSMASPHVAGIAAIYLGNDSSLTPAQVSDALEQSASSGVVGNAGNGSPNLLAYVEYDPQPPQCASAEDNGKACTFQGPCSGVCENGSCVLPDDSNLITFMLTTDNYPTETNWELRDSSTSSTIDSRGMGTYQSPGTSYCEQMEVQEGDYTFEIKDNPSYNDGICCNYGQGSYSLYQGNAMKKTGGDFGASEMTSLTVGGGGPPPPPPCGGTCGGDTPFCSDDQCVQCLTSNDCTDTACTIGTCNAGACSDAPRDTDGDSTPDCEESCPTDPNKTEPGVCGCNNPDVDSDGDGTLDCQDECPDDPDKILEGTCGCGVSDIDSDLDGTPDCDDGCPTDPTKTEPGECGCNVPEGTCAPVCTPGRKRNGRKCWNDSDCRSCNCDSRRCRA